MAKTIMVVDDEKDIRDSVKTLMETNGYSVITASNGDECLEKLKETKPDLIIMDIMMPGKPVKEVLKEINGVKVVLLSVVRTSEAEQENIMGKNVVDYIQKPFDINDLVARIKKVLK